MPAKKEKPRTSLVGVKVTLEEKAAIKRQAKLEGRSESDMGRELMLRGNLSQLVSSFFGDQS